MIWSQLVFKDAQGCRHSQKLMSAMAECTRGDVSAGTLTLEKAVHDVAGYNSMYMNAAQNIGSPAGNALDNSNAITIANPPQYPQPKGDLANFDLSCSTKLIKT